MGRGFKLESAEVPARRFGGLYAQIVDAFVDSGAKSKRVVLETPRPAKSLQIGLQKAIKAAGRQGGVFAIIRGDDVYLSTEPHS